MPDPRYNFIEYVKWYPNHYYGAIKQILNLKSHQSVLITGAVLLPAAFVIDNRVRDFACKKGLYSKSISKIGYLYGHPWGYIGSISIVALTGIKRNQPFTKTLSQIQLICESVLTTSQITSMLKNISHRKRPNGTSYKSFPSGHTSCSFALAACLNEIYGRKIGQLSYLMAGFVASSRINDNKHYLSDVVAGAILGIVIGRSFANQHHLEYSINYDQNILSANIKFPIKL